MTNRTGDQGNRQVRPFLMCPAVASVAAVIAATSMGVSAGGSAAETSDSPPLLSERVALTALSDISVQGLYNAYWSGYGDYIGSATGSGDPDPYYPGVNNILVTGPSGVVYYVVDNVVDEVANVVPIADNLDNYYFEMDSAFGIGPSAVVFVGANEYLGPLGGLFVDIVQNPLVFARAVFIDGLRTVVPTTDPIPGYPVGGGNLADVYFNGYNGNIGLPALINYAGAAIGSILPSGSLLPLQSSVSADSSALKTTTVKTVLTGPETTVSGTETETVTSEPVTSEPAPDVSESVTTVSEAVVDSLKADSSTLVAPEGLSNSADTASVPALKANSSIRSHIQAIRSRIRAKVDSDARSQAGSSLSTPSAADTSVDATDATDTASPSTATAQEKASSQRRGGLSAIGARVSKALGITNNPSVRADRSNKSSSKNQRSGGGSVGSSGSSGASTGGSESGPGSSDSS